MTINSKHTTPELPVLEGAAAELLSLDEFGLLPMAAIDLGSFEATTPTTAIPASPEDEDEDLDHEGDGAREVCLHLEWDGPFPREGSYMPMWCHLHELSGGRAIIVPALDGQSSKLPEDLEQQRKAGLLFKLWCLAESDGLGGMQIAPCRNGAGEPLPADGSQWAFKGLGRNAFQEEQLGAPTMIMVSNLPPSLSQEDFIEILDREEASGLYDFVFMPTLTVAQGAPRAAVVHCVSNEVAVDLSTRLSQRTFWGRGSAPQHCAVQWARNQSLSYMLEICRSVPENCGAFTEQVRPQLFRDGWPVPMPAPLVETLLGALIA